MKLFVEMKQFAAGVLEEEFTNQNEGRRKDIHKQCEGIEEDGCCVGTEENSLVGYEVLELPQKPEAQSEQ